MSTAWKLPSTSEFHQSKATIGNAEEERSGTASAVLLALRAANVQFVRFATIDCSNGMRCKVVPVDHLLEDPSRFSTFGPCIAEACFAGLPSNCDVVVAESGLSAARVLVLKPDLASLRVLPYAPSSAFVMGDAHDQVTKEPSPLCTRLLLKRVKHYAASDFGLAFTVGAELEFCLVDAKTGEFVDQSLFTHPTTLNEQDGFISDLYKQLKAQGISVELIHAESAPGQLEVVLKKREDVLRIADDVVLARETVTECAKAHNLRAIFLAKTSMMQAGSGMHVHISFRDLKVKDSADKDNAFSNNTGSSDLLSPRGSSFVEGLLEHLPALLSLSIPSKNSFRRVGPGCWCGSSIDWAVEDKEAALRVCLDSKSGKPSNVEFKLSDSCANIYMELAALLSAGLDGIAKKSQLRPSMSEATKDDGALLPKTFQESLDCLRKDEFLCNVLGEELCKGYLAVKAFEVEASSNLELEDEVKNALSNA